MAIATLGVVTVLDCPDPRALAEFYAAVLGWEVEAARASGSRCRPGAGRRLAFQESPGFVPPQWPGTEHAQQFHLDLDVPLTRMDEAEQEVLALGARLLRGRRRRAAQLARVSGPGGAPVLPLRLLNARRPRGSQTAAARPAVCGPGAVKAGQQSAGQSVSTGRPRPAARSSPFTVTFSSFFSCCISCLTFGMSHFRVPAGRGTAIGMFIECRHRP